MHAPEQSPVRPVGGGAAIVLAGGRSARMGRDKAALSLAGRDLLSHVVAAASAAGPVVVVAPQALADHALDDAARAHVHAVVVEDPPFGGPVAGIAAGVAVLPARCESVVVLACDLPRAAQAVAPLLAPAADAALAGADAVAPVDAEGYRQLLAARYRVGPLRDALAALPDGPRDVSVRRLTRGLDVAPVAVPAAALEDVDTPEQAARHGITL